MTKQTSMEHPTHNQAQRYNGKVYAVSRLIDIAKDLPLVDVDVAHLDSQCTLGLNDENIDLYEIVNVIKRIENADLKYPILLYRGFLLDGKHRLAKAILQNKKKIKARILTELPEPDA